MKKILFLLLLLIPFKIYAKDQFALSFATEQDIFSFETIDYNGGYLVSDYDGTKGILRYYDLNGNLKNTKTLENKRVATNMFIIDDELYVLTCEITNGANAHLSKLDEDLNVVKDANLNHPFYRSPIYSGYLSFVERVGDNISIWYQTSSKLLVVNKDLETINYMDATTANRQLYAPGLLNRNSLYNPNFYDYIPTNVVGSEFVFDLGGYSMGLKAIKVCDEETHSMWQPDGPGVLFEECYKLVFDVYDSTLTKMWTGEITGYETIYNAKVVGDYLVLIGTSSNKNSAIVYDLEGNQLQIIDNNTDVVYSYINKVENGFALSERCGTPNDVLGSDDCRSRHQIYILNNGILKETEGKGNIAVPENAIVGEVVTIEVEPEKGYVLGELLVVDEDGNTIPVQNNTFVMGLKKVTVKATFVPVSSPNPITGNHGVYAIIIVSALCGILFISYKRKLNFLK